MAFNIVVIVGLLLQGIIIFFLAKTLEQLYMAVLGVAAYFQAMAEDLGYPKLTDFSDETGELREWCESRNERNKEN